MKFGTGSTWTSLACLGTLLTAVAGCQMPNMGQDKGSDGNGNNQNGGGGNTNIDPSTFTPGDPSQPGGTTMTNPMPNMQGSNMPAPRVLALDLTSVAGFAIMQKDDANASANVKVGLDGTSAMNTGSGAASAGSASSSIWLSSTVAGQVLTRAPDLSAAAQRVAQFVARADVAQLGETGTLPGGQNGWSAQTDTGNVPAPTPDQGAAGAAGAPAGGTDGNAASGATGAAPSGSDDVGQQTGLLKIANDGTASPALVTVDDSSTGATGATGDGAGASGATGATGDGIGASGATGATGDGIGASGATAGDGTGTPPAANGGTRDPNGGGTGTAGAPNTTPSANPPVQNQPPQNVQPLPRVTALGLSPDGSVYVLFESGFIYRAPTTDEAADPNFNPYDMNSPLRCQLFRADGSWKPGAAPADKNLAKLDCVTNQYQVPTWDTARTMQFDASGKLYFRATTQNNPQGIFMQYDPTTKQLTEKVNANICWQDVQVTPRGSVFYTGMSMTNGQCGGSGTTGAFFRYVSADNKLTEIARNWWDFKYLAEQDPNDPSSEKIIFYGPDPNASGDANWNTACLYQYDPSITTPADRTTQLVDCATDGNSYVSGTNPVMGSPPATPTADQLPGYVERCESEGQLFINGNSVTALSQLQDGTLFVVGDFQRKLAGQLQCGMDVAGDHCALNGTGSNGDAPDLDHSDEVSCTNANHHWVTVGGVCSNSMYGDPASCADNAGTWTPYSRHYETTGDGCNVSGPNVTMQHINCNPTGINTSLFDQITGLAYVVRGTDGGLGEIRLLSDPTEQVERYWPLPSANGPELYYSVYSSGQYNLRRVSQISSGDNGPQIERQDVLNDFEVYNLQRDPSAPTRVLLDALQFSTNSYVFGSIDPTLATPADVQNSLQVLDGVSGKIDTLIILPNF